jgi:CHAD domain-containing protein
MAFQIDPEAPVGTGLLKVIRGEIRTLIRTVGRGARGSQRQRVRRARTGCKRIRAALKLFRCSAREFYETYNTYFRDAGRQLSEIRDAEVLLPAFDQLVEHQCTPAQRDGFAPLRLFLVARRRRIAGNPKAVERALSDFIRHMRVALVRLSSYKPAGEDFEVISGGLRLAFARGRRAYRAACRSDRDLDFHQWRKASKVVRYHHRLLRRIWPPDMKALKGSLDDLSGLLGEDQDLSMVSVCLAEGRKVGLNPGRVKAAMRLIAQVHRESRAAAKIKGALLFDPKPGTWLRRIELQWRISCDGKPKRDRRRLRQAAF